MTVVLIDEIDALLEVGHGGAGGGGGGGRGSQASSSSVATQDALYRLFEWPCRKHSTLVLVSIANRIDLLSRFLPLLGRRGIEPTQIIFSPYNAKAVLEILQSRLHAAGVNVPAGGSNSVIKPEALELLARTIAKKSGDARRALDLFRRTVELKLQKVRSKKAARKRKRESMAGAGRLAALRPRGAPGRFGARVQAGQDEASLKGDQRELRFSVRGRHSRVVPRGQNNFVCVHVRHGAGRRRDAQG